MKLDDGPPKLIAMSAAFDWPTFLPAFREAAGARGFAEEVLLDTAAGPLCVWTRAGKGRHVYVSAGIHGDEPAGPLAMLRLMQDGCLDADTRWTLCPAINPTGLAAGTRDTAAGIDLNRDYLRRQSPEVQAHANWLERRDAPNLFLSLHEDWETSGFYFYEINQCEEDPERARSILQSVSPWFPAQGGIIDGHDVREPGWIFHAAEPDLPDGWPEAIFMAKQRRCMLSFTFETPSQTKLDDRVAAHVAAVKAALD